jgi:transposase
VIDCGVKAPRVRKVLVVREVDAAERAALEKLASSRKAEARLVERAAIVWRGLQGQPARAIAADLKLDGRTVAQWLKRFDAGGLAALEDAPRRGRPATYSPEERAEVVAAALRRPQELNLPFGCWSLDRLTTYLHEHKQLAMKRSRVGEILVEEGLRWRKHESWFSAERVDPDFAQKKGGHRAALHGAARRQRGALPGRNGSGVGQKPPGRRTASDRPRSGATRRPRPAGN